MKKPFRNRLTLGFLLIGIVIFGQEFEFDIHNTSLSEYLKMEQDLDSEQIPNIRNHVSFDGNAQPIKFKRKQKIISDLVAYYYFKKKDSTMSHILFEWDESLMTLKSNTNDKKSEKYQKTLIRKYNDLEKTITEIYGKSKSKGDLSNLKQANEKGGLKKKDKWFPNDSTEIEIYTSVSNYYEKRGMVTTAPTHRIRLYIRNTKKEKKIEPKLSEKKLDTLKLISRQFIRTLGNKDLVKSKEYLSELILKTVTDDQLNTLIDNLDFNRETELNYSGIQAGLDGNIFTTLQFRYKDDLSNPPNELIKIIFDDKDKVVGIQPIKMQGKITD
tara:strand:+ start:56 stop:1039 length:984 start_codon:yes stop_codon:yes gene_type:complete